MHMGESPALRAKAKELFGEPWPFPDDVCVECLRELSKTPEYRERFDKFSRAINGEFRADMDKLGRDIKESVRAATLKVLDFADGIAGKM